MDHWSIIDDIAAAAGISANTRRMWRERGVPYRYHLMVVTEAQKRGVEMPASALRPSPPHDTDPAPPGAEAAA